MDYTEQFIRLNCSLMSDYKMMKLNADMKCMGLGLYLETILFLRKQQEYKHDFNELDLWADQWGAVSYTHLDVYKRQVLLNRPFWGLHVPPGIWASEQGFSSGSICLVLALSLIHI